MRCRLLLLLPLLLPAWSRADDDLRTVAERSDYQATSTSDEVLALCRALDARSDSVRLGELGRSSEGRSIPLLFVAEPMVATPEEARASGKLVVLVLGNIHSGEVCGKEALPALVRELTDAPGHPLLKDLILAVVPNFNPDGNDRMDRGNRPGQVGPEQGMGTRSNAQGLNINRDLVKLETPEARGFVRFLNAWDPHVVIDTHTTNGSRHRYVLTYQGPQNPAGDAEVLKFVRNEMLPAVDAAFEQETGKAAYFYGNFEDDHAKWTGFPDTPRFLTNYVGLRGRIAILTEAYAYATYRERIEATRDFVRACLNYAAAHREPIATLLDEARERAGREGSNHEVAIRSEPRPFAEPVTILGYDGPPHGALESGSTEPRDFEGVTVVQDYQPIAVVRAPFAYLIPREYGDAIDLLRKHGITVERLAERRALPVGQARVTRVERASGPFEGHRLTTVEAPEIEWPTEPTKVEAGTFVVRADQPLRNLLVYLLEPSDDGLCVWNLFDDGLKAGALFPVLRLDAAANLPLEPLADEPAKKRITFETLLKGPRPNLSGSPASPRWLDADHWIEVREGKLVKVDARGDDAEPLFDTDRVADALSGLPGLDQATAKRLAGTPAVRLDGRSPGLRGPRFGGSLIDPDRKGMLLDVDEDLYYATLDGKTAERLTSTPGAEELAEFSPDGTYVAYVRDNDLYVVDVATGTERALTTGGTDLVRHGKADWVYYEEIFGRNWKAFWWSPDGSHLAFLECDDRPVGTHAVLNDVRAERVVEETPYPKAGQPNPRVRLGIVAAAGGPVAWADLADYSEDSFLFSGVGWLDGDSAYAYAQNRTQTWLDLLKVEARDGSTTRLFRETTGAWVENPGDVVPLKDGGFLFPSERTGWKHIYRYKADGNDPKPLTSGEYEVRAIEHVDEDAGQVYFTATKDGPLAVNLYRVPLDGGEVERLTEHEGNHSVALSPGGALVLDNWSTPDSPPKVALLNADGEQVRMVDENEVKALDDWELAPRERVQIPTRDGFPLEAEILTPHEIDPEKVYPVWLMTYGGPHTPTLGGGWGVNTMAEALATEGFVVLRVDPRSASGKGAVSAHSAYRQLGVQELEDIKDALAWLKREKPFVDGNRIGMAGHSYGGYLTAYCMTHSDLFAAGIAGAPVTDWRDYDSFYTERFMLTPQENPEGYDASSVVKAAANLHGRLLILHGAIDDNVSLRNTMRLVHALQQADRDFEMMIYPSSRHGISGPHYSRLQLDFIRRALGGPKDREETSGGLENDG